MPAASAEKKKDVLGKGKLDDGIKIDFIDFLIKNDIFNAFTA